MAGIIPPTRDQLYMMAQGDQRTALALEALFDVSGAVSPDEIAAITLSVNANTAAIATAETDITGLQADVAQNTSDIAALGALVYSLAKAKGNTAGADVAGVEAEIPWASVAISSPDVTVFGSSVTIGADGVYKITATLQVEANNQTELEVRTYIDTGSGYSALTDEVATGYVAHDATQTTGGVTLATALSLNDGDVLQFRAFANCDGTCVMVDPGTRLIVERVA